MSEEIKDEALQALQGLLDDVVRRVREKFTNAGLPTVVNKIDYVAQIAVLEFHNASIQPNAEQCDAIGVEMRQQWPGMPDLQATLFRLANRNSRLILNISTADVNLSKETEFEDEDFLASVMANAPGPKQAHIPIVKYDLTKDDIVREQTTVEVTRDALG